MQKTNGALTVNFKGSAYNARSKYKKLWNLSMFL